MGTEVIRKDVLWKDAATVRGYERSRPAVPFEQEEFDLVVRVLDAHGVAPDRLLDLGAGDGLATASIINRRPVGHATMVDFSRPMLDAAVKRFAESTGTSVLIVEGDLYEPSWIVGLNGDTGFDLVISRHAIHHLPDTRKQALYREVLDLLRPGGMFVNIEHVRSANGTYQDAFDRLMVDSIHAHAPAGTPYDDVLDGYRTRMDGELNILADAWEQARWLEDIGFVSVDIPFKAFELAVICGQRPA